MFENLGGGEVLLIFLVILIFFGPKKIPELAGSLGKGLRKFREAKDGLDEQLKTVLKEPMEALQSAKSNFEAQINAAAQPVKEAAKAIEGPAVPAALPPVPTPAPVQQSVEPIPPSGN
ncbi:MAG TPA: twin-arginine translocase TatA/TatE family subunit [Candidatus Kapabacteria bacterium]|nr:twin-arginine translocase TatA/TatE family subunit [Candidatus Kapabacteria bacterium]